jgi:RecQ family ATP-dependent DNA helicase
VPVQARHLELGVLRAHFGSGTLRVTSPERTLVDLLRRPDLENSRLDTWNDLQQLPLDDAEELLAYLKVLRSKVINGKVGYFLNCLGYEHPFRGPWMSALTHGDYPVRKEIGPWDQRRKAPSWPDEWKPEVRTEWAIRVPGPLILKELRSNEDSTESFERTHFGGGEIPDQWLEHDLLQNFKFEGYRPGQLDLVRAALDGRDALGILPTGSGKSMTYLQPSHLLTGPTIVISPLVSLIEDQVLEARKISLNAFAMNKANRKEFKEEVKRRITDQSLHLIFVPPESWRWLFNMFPRLRTRTRLIVVDEAHVVVKWGQTFRAAYRSLRQIREVCKAPILALTATATPRTQREIATGLGLKGIKTKGYPVRKDNLFLKVEQIELPYEIRKILRSDQWTRAAEAQIRDAVFWARWEVLMPYLGKQKESKGIIYCNRKADAKRLASELQKTLRHRVVVEYHGDQGMEERSEILTDFKRPGSSKIMVATVAFGLGIHIPDLRFVVHFGMPSSLDEYTQAIGRAGRDENPANCLVIHVKGEEKFLKRAVRSMRTKGKSPVRSMRRQLDQISKVVHWIKSPGCRQQKLDAYFEVLGGNSCGENCDCCKPRMDGLPSQRMLIAAENLKEDRHVSPVFTDLWEDVELEDPYASG